MMRPYFSIIIPCYNSGDTIGELLESIVQQNMSKEELEVIISDDNSTEPYDDIVDAYKNELNIKKIKTDYNFGPGNTRQKGVEIATGQWITFIDHDDMYVPDVFNKIKDYIELNRVEYFVGTSIYANYEKDTGEYRTILEPQNAALHGKFFNLDNLWNKYNIHFKKDLFGSEDVYIMSQINYIHLTRSEVKYFVYKELVSYYWIKNDNSISRNIAADFYLETTFKDQIDATIYTIIEQTHYFNKPLSKKYAFKMCFNMVLECYILLEFFKAVRPLKYKRANKHHLNKAYKTFYKEFDIDSYKQLVQFLEQDNYSMVKEVNKRLELCINDFNWGNEIDFILWLKRMDRKMLLYRKLKRKRKVNSYRYNNY